MLHSIILLNICVLHVCIVKCVFQILLLNIHLYFRLHYAVLQSNLTAQFHNECLNWKWIARAKCFYVGPYYFSRGFPFIKKYLQPYMLQIFCIFWQVMFVRVFSYFKSFIHHWSIYFNESICWLHTYIVIHSYSSLISCISVSN